MTQLAPTLQLRGGSRIPQLGLGTYKIDDEQAPEAIVQAVELGYRHFDTAEMYGNERGIGEGMRRSGLPRGELFVTSKVWHDHHGYDEALRAFDESAARLGLDEIDLYLIHWPAPAQGTYVETWRALLRLRDEGRAHAIGVANFKAAHLQRLIDETGEAPELNQVELHVSFQQPKLREFDAAHGILTEAWSPLNRGVELDLPEVQQIAAAHAATPAQVILAWHRQVGNVVIPKAAGADRQRENFDSLQLTLSEGELAAIAALDTGVRGSADPDTFE